MKRLLILISLAAAAFAQPRFMATTGDVSLSAAATAFTIQQPSSGAKTVSLESAVVYCSTACDISQAQNGSAATATAGTVRSLPPQNSPASATVWTASNVGAGTATAGITHLTAAGTVVLDLSQMKMAKGNTGTNYTVSIASMTGTVNITLYWSEQ